ncbi:arsenate reductase [Salmonella enterica]|nr:arsenate reductase [Salmonella enterica]EJB1336090.1 arsenate reductase [Salmonella enterica]
MSKITIYRNPACGTSRNTLEMISVRALLRKNVEPYEQLGLDEDKFSDEQLIDFMLLHPILINRPVIVAPFGTRLCRPSGIVLDILPEGQKGSFTKEDVEKVIDETGKRVKCNLTTSNYQTPVYCMQASACRSKPPLRSNHLSSLLTLPILL